MPTAAQRARAAQAREQEAKLKAEIMAELSTPDGEPVQVAQEPEPTQPAAPPIDMAAIVAMVKAELRAEVEAQVRAELAAVTPDATPVTPEDTPVTSNVTDEPEFTPIEFWAITGTHKPRLKKKGGGGYITFVNGRYVAKTQDEADYIMANLRGQVWPADLPDNIQPKRDDITGYAPRSFAALEQYREFITPIFPQGWEGR